MRRNMKKQTFAAFVFCYLLVADCAADWSTFYDPKRVDVSSQLNLTFSADDVQYRRIEALRNHQKEGWVEDGT